MENYVNLIGQIAGIALTIIAGYLSKVLLPMLNNKVKSQKNAAITQAYDVAFSFAKNTVVPLAVNDCLGNSDKRSLAIQKVAEKLDKVGINLPADTINSIVERAYQTYKSSGGDIHKLDLSNVESDDSDNNSVTVDENGNVDNDQQEQQVTTTINQNQPNNPYKGSADNE